MSSKLSLSTSGISSAALQAAVADAMAELSPGGGIDSKAMNDPGALGAGKIWLNMTIGQFYIRNEINTRWLPVGPSGQFNVKWLEADGNGVTNDRAAWQATFDYLGNQGYMPQLIVPPGNYVTDGLMTYPVGIKVKGFGSGNTHAGPVKMLYKGPTDADVFVMEDLGGLANAHGTKWEGICVTCVQSRNIFTTGDPANGGTLHRFRHAWNWFNRGDLGSTFIDCVGQGGSGFAFYFPNGGINTHIRGCRSDVMGRDNYGGFLYFHPQRPNGNDVAVSVRECTIDNVITNADQAAGILAGGGIWLDMEDVNGVVSVQLEAIKYEPNYAMGPDNAMLKVMCEPHTGNLTMHQIEMNSNFFAHPSSLQGENDILITPRTGMVQIIGGNNQIKNIVGHAQFRNSVTGTSGIRPTIDLLGKSPEVPAAPGAADTVIEHFAPHNFAARRFYRFGKPATIVTNVNPTLVDQANGVNTGTTIELEDEFKTRSNLSVTRYVCTTPGTQGSLVTAGGQPVTGSAANGQPYIDCNDASRMSEGQYINIVGANQGVQIAQVWGNRIALRTNVSEPVTDAVITFRTALFGTRAETYV